MRNSPGTFIRAPFCIIQLVIVLTAATISIDAYTSTCPDVGKVGSIAVKEVTYLTAVPKGIDLRASGNKIELRGLLYYKKAESVENRSVLIYNHGHDQARAEPCAIVKFFTNEGWVVFAPLRRGHFFDDDGNGKPGAKELRSTGIHIDEYTENCMRSYELANFSSMPEFFCTSKSRCRPDVPCGLKHKRNAVELGYLNNQHVDVREQIAFIKLEPAISKARTARKLADPARVAVLGHSYGGSLIVLTNQHNHGQNVMIDISGAELSWGADEPYWQIDLVFATHAQKRPIYFLQPENGISTEPTKVLSKIAQQESLPFEAKIFPPAPCSKTKTVDNKVVCDTSTTSAERQAHGTFVTEDEQVELWGPTVIAFSERHVKKTAPKRKGA